MVCLEKESGTGSKLLLQSEQRMRLLNKCLLLPDTLSNLRGLAVCSLHAYSVSCSLLGSMEGVLLVSRLLSCFRAEMWLWVKTKAQVLTTRQLVICHKALYQSWRPLSFPAAAALRQKLPRTMMDPLLLLLKDRAQLMQHISPENDAFLGSRLPGKAISKG